MLSGRVAAVSVRITGLVLICLILAIAFGASAAVPQKISYQGRLTEPAGNPMPGEHTAMFAIYDDPSEGILLWSESKTVTADADGVFSTILGSVTPLSCSFDEPRWLEVYIDGMGLAPRREIVSVASALVAGEAAQAGNADSLGGVAADAYAVDAHTHSSLAASDGNPAQAIYVNADGKVGINTTSPAYQLSVVADPTGSGCRAIHGAVLDAGDEPDAFGVVGETWSSGSTLVGAGVLGRASSTSGGSYGVYGSAHTQTGAGVFGWADHTSGNNYGVKGVTSSPNGFGGYFQGAKNYFSGRVGIGTDSPLRLLHVHKGYSPGAVHASADLILESDEGTSIGFLSPNTTMQGLRFSDPENTDAGWIVYNHNSDNLRFGVDGTERMRIDRYGRVGIGTTGPIEELEVNGTIRVTTDGTPLSLSGTSGGYIDFRTTDTQPMGLRLENGTRAWLLVNSLGGADYFGIYNPDGPEDYKRALVVDGASSKVGVGTGTQAPTARLDVSNDTGYGQVRMRTSYTPSSTTDPNGSVGDIAWDSNYVYIKTPAGWKRAALSAWGL